MAIFGYIAKAKVWSKMADTSAKAKEKLYLSFVLWKNDVKKVLT